MLSKNNYCPLAPVCIKQSSVLPSRWEVVSWAFRYLLFGPRRVPAVFADRVPPLSSLIQQELDFIEQKILDIKAKRQGQN